MECDLNQLSKMKPRKAEPVQENGPHGLRNGDRGMLCESPNHHTGPTRRQGFRRTLLRRF